jgi:hypothetical protein
MRTFGAVFFAGITGAAILKILATLLAPLWVAIAAIFMGWVATIGTMILGWALLGLKIGGVILLGFLVLRWIKKKTSDEEPA